MKYTVESYNLRQEPFGHILFSTEHERCFVLNEFGRVVLFLLEMGIDSAKISSLLVTRQDQESGNAHHAFIDDFIEKALRYSILRPIGPSLEESPTSNVRPEIAPIEDYEKGKQCLTFGMPKRSCKSLPSGTR